MPWISKNSLLTFKNQYKIEKSNSNYVDSGQFWDFAHVSKISKFLWFLSCSKIVSDVLIFTQAANFTSKIMKKSWKNSLNFVYIQVIHFNEIFCRISISFLFCRSFWLRKLKQCFSLKITKKYLHWIFAPKIAKIAPLAYVYCWFYVERNNY